MKNSFTRIQTIAHECLHSIQGKNLLIFNFIFSNIYLLYFIVISVLAAFNILPNNWLFLGLLSVLEDKTTNWKIKLVDTDLRQLPTEITQEVKDALEKEKGRDCLRKSSYCWASLNQKTILCICGSRSNFYIL